MSFHRLSAFPHRAPTVTLSLTTIAELVFASAFILSVVLISRKSSIAAPASSTGTKKSKSKKKARKVDTKAPEKEVVEAPALAPAAVEAPAPKAAKKKAASKPPSAVTTPVPTDASATAPSAPSFAAIATPDAPSPSAPKAKKTFVESRLRSAAPTAMDDMRDESINPVPQVARVMRIVDGKANVAKLAQEWDEWEEPKEEQGEWEVAKVKSAFSFPRRQRTELTSFRRACRESWGISRVLGVRCFEPCASTIDPWSLECRADGDDEEAAREPEEGGARRGGQGGCGARANGAAGGAQAAAGAYEVPFLFLLALSRRELISGRRMIEQEKERNKGKAKKGPRSEDVGARRAKEQSGGMRAQLDDAGKLIWE